MLTLLLTVLLLQASSQAQALALRGPFPSMFVNDVFVGQTPSAATTRDRLTVVNTGQDPIGVVMLLEPCPAGELRDGYEPIPNLSWIQLDPPRFSLEPGESGVSAILVSPPNDPSLQGGQFELVWRATATVPSSGAELLPRSHIFVTIQLGSATVSSITPQAMGGARVPVSVPFTLSPPGGIADNVPLGRKMNLRDLGFVIKLGNPNSQDEVFSVRSACDNSNDSDQVFRCSPNPNFLMPAASTVRVPANSVAEAVFTLQIPNEARYQGRHWVFVAQAAPVNGVPSDAKAFRLTVTTQSGGAR